MTCIYTSLFVVSTPYRIMCLNSSLLGGGRGIIYQVYLYTLFFVSLTLYRIMCLNSSLLGGHLPVYTICCKYKTYYIICYKGVDFNLKNLNVVFPDVCLLTTCFLMMSTHSSRLLIKYFFVVIFHLHLTFLFIVA